MAGPLRSSDRRVQQFRRLTEVSRALTYAISLDEILQLAVRRAAELLETDKAILMLTNADGLLSVRAAFGLEPAASEQFREPLDETLLRRLQGLLDVAPERFLGVPLVVSGEVTGILAVALRPDAPSVEEDEWLLSALADQAAVALEKTRLDVASEFRERVIGIVSHDLRSPLQAVVIGAQALLMTEELSDRNTAIVARIKRSGERASRMIRDLLDYTQVHLGGGIPIQRRTGDLYGIVYQVVDETRAVHPTRDIEINLEGDGNGLFDTDRLAQVIGNLLSNALAYSPPDTPIRITGHDDGDAVSVSVQNRGAPIEPALQSRIFEPMQRAAEPSSNQSRSVGLGLYIVRHVIEAHGGTISVQSNHGDGTTFTFRLPRGSLLPPAAVV